MGKIKYINSSDTTLLIILEGDWCFDQEVPCADDIISQIDSLPDLKQVTLNRDKLTKWDSGLLSFLFKINIHCLGQNILFQKKSLENGMQRLLSLATAVPERKKARKEKKSHSFLTKAGTTFVNFTSSAKEMLNFLGEATIAFLKLISGQSSMRQSVFMPIFQDCSSGALPIVSLISALVGLILAFVGAIQLVMFGAEIYVASLVGISIIRVMGAVMTGVIMAGRTGAAFAAQLGTMEVNEEIDALKTLGISPMEYLVLPRMLALAITMPLLCLYADLMGIIGGMIVGVFMLDLNFMEYFNMTRASISLNDFSIGLFHSLVFGILVALAGCLRGMQCKRSASAVGDAATSAVVTGIVAIVIATAVITLLCNIIGI